MKSMKKILFAAALPIIALTTTSCGSKTSVLSYEEAKQYASDHYDSHALDTVPINYKADINKCGLNAVISLETPSGGTDEVTLSFALNGIHVSLKDYYATCVSSVLIDEVERFNSIFTSFALETAGFMPLEFNYLLNGDSMTFEIGMAPNHAADFAIRLASLLTGVLGGINDVFGYINEESPIYSYIGMASNYIAGMMGKDDEEDIEDITATLCKIINYYDITINTSSTSSGDKFLLDLSTDGNGYITGFKSNCAASFNISGVFIMNTYASDEPAAGDHPIGSGNKYRFIAKGSYDYDVALAAQFA